MKRLTKEEFIKQAREIHGDKYDYSLVEYKGNKIKVSIICKEHGIFLQTPHDHLDKHGCPICKAEKTKELNKFSKEDFIERAKKVHGYKYDYSLVEYIDSKTNVKIICPVHGVFEQRPSKHLYGQGCPDCSKENRSVLRRSNSEEFIKQAREIHGDKYDYSLVEYVNSRTNVKIICPVHGVFEQKPTVHLMGTGCPKCVGRNRTTEEFIKQAREIHGDKYDYSLVEYVNSRTNVKIICPVHGVFEQKPTDHLQGRKCPECYGTPKKTTEEFIKQAREIHGDKYDYSLVEYKGAHVNVNIICPVHGVFEQTPHSHLKGCECPNCRNNYKLEKEIKSILQKEKIDNITQKTFDWLIYKYKMRLDFYIPEYNVAIECQGKQHFEQVEHFGGEDEFIGRIDRDKKKRELCEQHGIKVFYYANYQYDFPYKVYTDPEELIAEIKKIDPINKI